MNVCTGTSVDVVILFFVWIISVFWYSFGNIKFNKSSKPLKLPKTFIK